MYLMLMKYILIQINIKVYYYKPEKLIEKIYMYLEDY